MKKLGMIIVTLILVISISTVGLAAGINGDYQGNAIVNVVINGVAQIFPKVPAINFNGSTLLPLRACVEGVNGIVEWDAGSQTASVIKPEASINFFVFKEDGENIEGTYSMIPVLDSGKKYYSVVDIGGIPKGTYTIKCEIINQGGTVIYYTNDTSFTLEEDNDMYSDVTEWESFDIYAEIYKFKVSMKDKSGAYKTIAVKTMKYDPAE